MDISIHASTQPRYGLLVEDDFKIQNHLQIFESHMFLTTDWSISKQQKIPPFQAGLGNGVDSRYYDYSVLEQRKSALQDFNKALKEHVGHTPTNKDVGCFLITFDDTEDAILFQQWFFAAERTWMKLEKNLSSLVLAFSRQTGRVSAITPHFFQEKRCPHWHCLYEKREGTEDDNLLQRFIMERFNK